MKSSKRFHVSIFLLCIALQAIVVPVNATTASLVAAFLSAVPLFAASSIAAPTSPLNAYTNQNGIQTHNDFLAPPLIDTDCNSLERPPFCVNIDSPDINDNNDEYPDVILSTPSDAGIDDVQVISARLLKRRGWSSPTVSELPTWSNTWDSVTSSVSNAVSSAKSWWYGDSGSSATVSAPVAIIEPDMPSLPASTKGGLWSTVTNWWNGDSAAVATSSTPAIDVLSSIPSEPANNNGFLSRLGNWWNGQSVSAPDMSVPELIMPDIPVLKFDTPGNPVEISIPEIIIPDGWMENSFSEITLPEILPPEIPPPAILPPTIPPPGLTVGDFSPSVDPIAEELLNWRNTYNPDLWESVPNEAAENYLDDNTAMPQVLVDLQNTYGADQESVTDEVEEYYLDSNVAIPKEFSDWSNSYNPDLWESGPTDISQQVAADPNLAGETRPGPSGPISDSLNIVPSSLQSGFSPSPDTYLEIPSKPASDTSGSQPVIEAPQDGLVEELVDWGNFYDPNLWESGPMDVSQQVASDRNLMPIVEAPRDKGKGREVSMDDSADLENVVHLQAIRVPKDGMRAPPGSFAQYDSHGNLYDFAGPSRIPDVPHNSLAGLKSYLFDSEDAEGLRAGPVSVPEDKGSVEYVYKGERIQDIEGYRDSFAGLQILRGPWDGLRAPQNSVSEDMQKGGATDQDSFGLPDRNIFVEEPERVGPTDSSPIPEELINWRDYYDRDWQESSPAGSGYDFEVSTILEQEPKESQPGSDVSRDSGFMLDRQMMFEEPESMESTDSSLIPEELLNWRDFYDPDWRESMPAGPRTDFEGPAENVLIGVPTISEPPLDFLPVLEESQSSQPGSDVSQDGRFMLDRNILFEEPERMDSTDSSPIPEELLNWRDFYDRDWRVSPPAGPSIDFEGPPYTSPMAISTIPEQPAAEVGPVESTTILDEVETTEPEHRQNNQADVPDNNLSPISPELRDWRDYSNLALWAPEPINWEEVLHVNPAPIPQRLVPDVPGADPSPIPQQQPDWRDSPNPALWEPEPINWEDILHVDPEPIPQELLDWQESLDPDLWESEAMMPSADFEEAGEISPVEVPTIREHLAVAVGPAEQISLLEEPETTAPEPVFSNQIQNLNYADSSPIPQQLPVSEPTVSIVGILSKPSRSTPVSQQLTHNEISDFQNLVKSETPVPVTYINTQNRKCNSMRQGLMSYEIDGDCFDDNVLRPQELVDWRDNLDPKLWSPEDFPST